MRAFLHNPTKADVTRYDIFCTLDFERNDDKHDEDVCLFLTAEQEGMARAIAAIFNGDIDALTARIDQAIQRASDKLRGDIADTDLDLAIACDLIGKDLDEALRERREAEDAA